MSVCIILSTILFGLFHSRQRIMLTLASPTISLICSLSRDVAQSIIISLHYVDEEVEAFTG